MRPVLALLGAAYAMGGCSLLTSLDDLGSTAADASGGTDAGSDAAAGNLISNPSFENGTGGCGTNWGNGYNGTFTRTSPRHTGQSACLVCVQPNATGSYELDSIMLIPVQAGSFYAEAWLTTPDGAAPTLAGIQINFAGDGGMSGCSGGGVYCQGSSFNPPTGSWSSSTSSFVVEGSGTLAIDLHSYGADPNTCFVVDDVALYAQ